MIRYVKRFYNMDIHKMMTKYLTYLNMYSNITETFISHIIESRPKYMIVKENQKEIV